MKINYPVLTLLLVLLTAATHLFAQHPLVGAWEMVSIKGIDAAGEKFFNDTSTVREIKIITPTHYVLIAQDVENDSLIFNRCYAGTIELNGNKYIEQPMLSSAALFDNVKTDYTWKVQGDRFIQSGTFTRPDGKKVTLDELVFRKVKSEQAYHNNPTNGAWKLLTSSYINVDGSKESYTNETVNCLTVITPTHWMYVSSRNKKFESAMGGPYTMKGNKYYPALHYTSFPKDQLGKLELTEKVEGTKLYISGISLFPDGRKLTWEDVFQKAE
jgi:hypothetical protein